MIDLMFAAALLQGAEGCNAVPPAPTAASCPAWRSVLNGESGEVLTDPASLRRTGDVVEVRTRTVFRETLSSGMRSATALERYDCAAQTYRLLHLQAFDAAGTTLLDRDTTDNPRAGPMNPQPGSPNAAVLAALCR